MLKTKKKEPCQVSWTLPFVTVVGNCSKELFVEGEVFGVIAREEMIGGFCVVMTYRARRGMVFVNLVPALVER